MSEGKALKVRVTFAIILVGVALMFTAVVTDHWAVLSPKVEKYNDTCEAAHFGLWRLCTKRIYITEEESGKDKSCGPISLPGDCWSLIEAKLTALGLTVDTLAMFPPNEVLKTIIGKLYEFEYHGLMAQPSKYCSPISLEHNCSYFTHFAPGESTEIFEVTTQREYSISAAAIAIFSVAFSIIGTLCVLLSFRKKMDYLLKPASMFYTFSGLCIIISVEVMRQSVKRMIDSDDTVWIEYYYSWSFACACASFVLLFICGIALLIVSLPRMPRNPWETCMDAEPEH